MYKAIVLLVACMSFQASASTLVVRNMQGNSTTINLEPRHSTVLEACNVALHTLERKGFMPVVYVCLDDDGREIQ